MAQLIKVVDQGWKKIADNGIIGPRVKKYQNINDLKRNKIEVMQQMVDDLYLQPFDQMTQQWTYSLERNWWIHF